MRFRGSIFALLVHLLLSTGASARVLESIPSHYVKVSVSPPTRGAPAFLSKVLAYIDGPVLYFKGKWRDPSESDVLGGGSPVPELLVPVRLVVAGANKLVDLESTDSVLGELPAETYTPDGRIYRILMPIAAMRTAHTFEVVFRGDSRTPLTILLDFEPPEGVVLRSPECKAVGVEIDTAVEGFHPGGSTPSLVYLYCSRNNDSTIVGLYGMEGARWVKLGYHATKILGDRGLYIKLPRARAGTIEAGMKAEFVAADPAGKQYHYGLRYNPPFRPRPVSVDVDLGLGYSNFRQTYIVQGIDEVALFARLALGAKLWVPGFDAGADVGAFFGSLWQGGARYAPSFQDLETNLRLGFVQPSTPAESEWSLMTGLYGWYLSINSGFGLNNALIGPELFARYKHRTLNSSSWWLGGQYALLNAGLSNYSLKLNYGVEVLGGGGDHPLSLNLEASRLAYFQNGGSQSLDSIVLSVGYALY